MFGVTCLWMVAFQASSVGSLCTVGRILDCDDPVGPSRGRVPVEEILTTAVDKGLASATGPCASVKTGLILFVAAELRVVSCTIWFARTGRFCVTTWPKLDPNTPMSKLRPYPRRTTVFGSN